MAFQLLLHLALAAIFVWIMSDLVFVTALVLLQTTPPHLRESIEKSVRDISTLDGTAFLQPATRQCCRFVITTMHGNLFIYFVVFSCLFPGVIEVKAQHWWSVTPTDVVGTLHVRLRSDGDEQLVLGHIHRVLAKVAARLTLQIEKDTPVDWLLLRR